MIHSLYQLTSKGLFKALSFSLASAMFLAILWHSAHFASHFGGKAPYLALCVFYGMTILWIHGIGFEIRKSIWRAIFLPLVGYMIVIPALIYQLIP